MTATNTQIVPNLKDLCTQAVKRLPQETRIEKYPFLGGCFCNSLSSQEQPGFRYKVLLKIASLGNQERTDAVCRTDAICRGLFEWSCSNGDLETTKTLLKLGVPLPVPPKRSEGLFHRLLQSYSDSNNVLIAKLLSEGGYRFLQESPIAFSMAWEKSRYGSKKYLAYLIQCGLVDVNHQRHVNCDSPLHWAIKMGYEGAAHFLLDTGASVAAKTPHGRSVVHLAAQFCQPKLLKHLLEMGVPRDQKDNSGELPIDLARKAAHRSENEQKQVIDILENWKPASDKCVIC